MIKREIQKSIIKAAKQFGIVSITGPRQSGKTTLSQLTFPRHQYVNLEDPAKLQSVIDDPKSFIKNIKQGVIIDEIQKYPQLLSYIQVSIDSNYNPGKFIITGSQNLLLSDKISQSLAGRVANLTLLPLSISELNSSKHATTNFSTSILNGFYPGLYDKKVDASLFYANYINTYVERDVRSISNIGDLTNFQRFLQTVAGRIGQLLNLTSISNDLGVSHKTIDSWISILEASYIAFRLQPYYKNYGKRVMKSPKLYFYDTGLVSYLLGIDSIKELNSHFSKGSLFENLVIADLLKAKYNHLSSSKIFYYRDRQGHEIDLLIDRGTKQIPIEIKSSSTYSTDFSKNLEYFNKTTHQTNKGYIVYTGNQDQLIKKNQLLSFNHINKLYKLI